MKNFIFKSIDTDLQKMFQLLETVQKNVLYSTYRTDSILKILNKLVVDKDLQHQVNEYFEQDARGPTHPEDEKDLD